MQYCALVKVSNINPSYANIDSRVRTCIRLSAVSINELMNKSLSKNDNN